MKRWPVMSIESAAVNRTQLKPCAIAWRRAIDENNPVCPAHLSLIDNNNEDIGGPLLNPTWEDDVPF